MEFIHVSQGIPLASPLAEAAKAAAAVFLEAGFSDTRPAGFNFRLLDGTEIFLTVQRRFPRDPDSFSRPMEIPRKPITFSERGGAPAGP